MRRMRGASVLVSLAAACAACASLLDIEVLPVRADDAGLDAPAVDASSDAVDCDATPAACACAQHDFCDDFDNGEALGERWHLPSGVSNPFPKGDAGIALTDAAYTPPLAVLTTSDGTNSASFAFLGNQVEFATLHAGKTFVGARYAVDLQLDDLSFVEVRGPIASIPSAIVAAVMGLVDSVPRGVGVLATLEGIYLFAATDLLGATKPDAAPTDAVLVKIFDGKTLEIAKSWLRVEILVADRDVAVKLGFASCATAPAGPIAAAGLFPGRVKQGCAALPSSFGGLAWAQSPVATAGGALFGGGSLRLRQDDVFLDFVEPP